MEAHVRKSENGKKWVGYVVYKDFAGKKHQKSAGRFEKKRDAQNAANSLAYELDSGVINPREVTYVDYYWEHYLTFIKPNASSRSSTEQYKVYRNFLAEYFGDKKLKDVTATDYQSFLNWFGERYSQEYARKLRAYTSKPVKFALSDGVINRDFTYHAKVTFNPAANQHTKYLNASELKRFTTEVESKLNPDSPARYMVLLAIYTGMRKAEIQGLTWDDIDSQAGTISINKSWDERKKAFKPTKTKSSNRIVAVPHHVLDHLNDLKANHNNLVFQNFSGRIPTSATLNNTIRTILVQCDLSKGRNHFSLHALRHTHVAYLLGNGVDIHIISKRLGHSSVRTTEEKYAYLIDEFKAKQSDLVIEKLGFLN